MTRRSPVHEPTILALLLGVAILVLAGATAAADPTDPIFEALVALREKHRDPAAHDGPNSLIQELTSWQSVPLFTVLGTRNDGDPDQYTMTHPLFAFGWRDGRLLVVDAGLALGEAEAFGKPTQWLGGGEVHCNPMAWRPLLEPGRRIAAVVFTHLHTDHTLGVRQMCGSGPVAVRLTPRQEASDSMFEARGRDQLREEAPDCVRFDPWQGDPLQGVDPAVTTLRGFAGVYSVAVPGHTPGSQMIVGFVRGSGAVKAVVISGDVVNHRLGFERNVAKPLWYRWLVVREDEAAQQRYRRLLQRLDAEGFEVLVNHDLRVAPRESGPAACAVATDG